MNSLQIDHNWILRSAFWFLRRKQWGWCGVCLGQKDWKSSLSGFDSFFNRYKIYFDLHCYNDVDTDMCAGSPTWKRSFGHGSGSRWKLSMKLDDFSFTFSSALKIVPWKSCSSEDAIFVLVQIVSGGGNGRLCRISEDNGEWDVREVSTRQQQ